MCCDLLLCVCVFVLFGWCVVGVLLNWFVLCWVRISCCWYCCVCCGVVLFGVMVFALCCVLCLL